MYSSFCHSVTSAGTRVEWVQLTAHLAAIVEAHEREVSRLHADARSLADARDWWERQANDLKALLTAGPLG